jgi:1,4-dihydroxy-2-naphthoate octaprenyltransferase
MHKKFLIQMTRIGRLHFLAGGIFLFTIGIMLAMLAGAQFTLSRFLFGYAIMGTAHLSLSYSNNYFDLAADRQGTPTMFSGGTKLLLMHPELRTATYRFSLALITTSLLLAVAFTLVYRYPPLFVMFVAGGNALAWYYTAPPFRLAYRGWGEVATMIAYGFLIPGMGFLTLSPRFEPLFFLFALPLLLYGLHFIITVELPDMEGDRQVDKKTFIVRYGRQVGMWTSGVLLGLATFYFVLMHLLVPLSESIDLRVIALLSLIPLGITLAMLIRMRQATISAVTLSYANISGVVAFLLLLNVYLLFLL